MSETNSKSYKAAVITVSDTRSSGENVDTVGPLLSEKLEFAGYDVLPVTVVPDEVDPIVGAIEDLADVQNVNLIITTGGTGLAPRDVTPDATLIAIEQEIPGIAEFIRTEGGKQTQKAWLSRARSGYRGTCLIVNVPGSERGAVHALETVLPILGHGIQTLLGDTHECGKKVGEADIARER